MIFRFFFGSWYRVHMHVTAFFHENEFYFVCLTRMHMLMFGCLHEPQVHLFEEGFKVRKTKYFKAIKKLKRTMHAMRLYIDEIRITGNHCFQNKSF